MKKGINEFKQHVLWVLLVESLICLVLYLWSHRMVALFLAFFLLIQILLFWWYDSNARQEQRDILQTLDLFFHNQAHQAFLNTKMGMILIKDGRIRWVNSYFFERYKSFLKKPLSTIHPHLGGLVEGEDLIIKLDRFYQVSLYQGVVLFQDIEELQQLRQRELDNQLVLGFCTFDNYREVVRDDSLSLKLDIDFYQIITTYMNRYNFIFKKTSVNKYFLVGKYQDLQSMVQDNFSLMQNIQQVFTDHEVPGGVSLVFASGQTTSDDLEKELAPLLELVADRGGDQVAIWEEGKPIQYFGNAIPHLRASSKVRARVAFEQLQKHFVKSSRIYIVGHQMADFDCLGSALFIASLAQYLGKEVLIITESGGIESKLLSLFNSYRQEGAFPFQFIDENTALEAHSDEDVVVAVDHNNPLISNGTRLLEKSSQNIVVDHHRRGEHFISDQVFNYIEPNASSTCEMVAEMLEFCPQLKISVPIATIMYGGILVDTKNFMYHSGFRTFEAAAVLQKMHLDIQRLRHHLSLKIADFFNHQRYLQRVQMVTDSIAICPLGEAEVVDRTILSMIGDQLIGIQEIEGVFVLGKISDQRVAISARSKNNFNVQIIMEEMGGGGHFNAAAYVGDQSQEQLLAQLRSIIERRN